jgi:hypothetical protein
MSSSAPGVARCPISRARTFLRKLQAPWPRFRADWHDAAGQIPSTSWSRRWSVSATKRSTDCEIGHDPTSTPPSSRRSETPRPRWPNPQHPWRP